MRLHEVIGNELLFEAWIKIEQIVLLRIMTLMYTIIIIF